MERYLKALKEFLSDSAGQKSSKRLMFLVSILNLILAFWFALIFLLIKTQYNLALELWNSFAILSGTLGGIVFGEVFKKK